MPQIKKKHERICKVAVLLYIQRRTGKLLSRGDKINFLLDTSMSDLTHLEQLKYFLFQVQQTLIANEK